MPEELEIMPARKKRRESVVQLAEVLGMTLAADVATLDDIKGLPNIEKESPRNQGIMAAVVAGYSQHFIAQMFGVSQPTINEIIRRIDPERMLQPTPEARKAFITKLLQSRAMESLSSITPEKLKDASASECARIAKTCMDVDQTINQTTHKSHSSSKLDMLMDAIASEAVDAEFEEIK